MTTIPNKDHKRQSSPRASLGSFFASRGAAAVARRRITRRTVVVSSVVVIAAGALLATAAYLTSHRGDQSPQYQTLAPKGTTIDTLGGWKRISPPKNDPVFAYADTVEGVAISVSQQPLPAAFKNDAAGNISELAKKFNATTKLVAGPTTAYIGTSAKGPQSVIFTKDGLLIMIKSSTKISDSGWIRYVQLLDPVH